MSDSEKLLTRLNSLYRHLTEEGWHVHANTVSLAIEYFGQEHPPVFWYRKLDDGLYEGPYHASSDLGKQMRESIHGNWTPLYERACQGNIP